MSIILKEIVILRRKFNLNLLYDFIMRRGKKQLIKKNKTVNKKSQGEDLSSRSFDCRPIGQSVI